MTKADYLHDDLTRLNEMLVAEILGEASDLSAELGAGG